MRSAIRPIQFLLANITIAISPALTASGTAAMATPSRYLTPDANGIYSAPVITIPTPATTKTFAPTPADYRNLTPWGAANLRYELKNAGTTDAFVEARSGKHPVVGVMKFPAPVPVADAVVEFEYRVPQDINPKEIHLNLRVQGVKKQYTMRLPVAVGKWQHEKIPLADIVGGDRWRFAKPETRLATSVEVGLITNGGGPATLQFRAFGVTRHPSCWGPLSVPRRINVPATGIARTFSTDGDIPRQAWLQVIADSPVDVILNDARLGLATLKNMDTQKWPNAPIPVAREFLIDTHLRTDRPNTLILRPAANSGAAAVPVLCALGYTTTDALAGTSTRHILVSDSAWGTTENAPADARPYKGNEPARWGAIVDIYPLRNPQAWTTPATSPHDATPLSEKELADKRAIASSLRISPDAFPQTGPATPWRTAAPGTPQNPSSRWKLLTPQDKPYHFLGMQVIGLFPRENYRYYRTMMDRYPGEADYLADTLAQVKELGFNGIAPANTTETAFRAAPAYGLTHFQFLGPAGGTPMKNHEGKTIGKWADPFNETWRENYRQRARDFAAKWRDDPAMIGVFVHNELGMDGSVNGASVIGYIYSPDCRAAFVKWLARRYENDVAKLRAAWTPELPAAATLGDFEAAPDINPVSARKTASPKIVSEEDGHAAPRQAGKARGAVQTDLYDFAVHAMGVYADFMLDTLRTALPGKLVASNRFMGNATDEMLTAWKNYDLIAWNAYPFGKWQAGLYTEGQLENLRRAHRITGKPAIISEIGLQALDARLPNPSAQLYTQKQRGEEYTKLLRQVHDELPFVVGFVLFCWQNLPDTERQSWGLLDQDGKPYADYADRVKQANHTLMQMRPGCGGGGPAAPPRPPPPPPPPPPHPPP
ncbi:MAG: beta-galactosidase, partial [Opitutaceae bacterium]|nr:beta-galactosidase [Opitutaceae bacterium]